MEKSFKLIDGKFNPSHAEEILYSFISNKMQFHNIQLLTAIERNSKTDHSTKRIKELQQISDDLKKIINKAKENNYEIEILCDFELKLIEPKKKANKVHAKHKIF